MDESRTCYGTITPPERSRQSMNICEGIVYMLDHRTDNSERRYRINLPPHVALDEEAALHPPACQSKSTPSQKTNACMHYLNSAALLIKNYSAGYVSTYRTLLILTTTPNLDTTRERTPSELAVSKAQEQHSRQVSCTATLAPTWRNTSYRRIDALRHKRTRDRKRPRAYCRATRRQSFVIKSSGWIEQFRRACVKEHWKLYRSQRGNRFFYRIKFSCGVKVRWIAGSLIHLVLKVRDETKFESSA